MENAYQGRPTKGEGCMIHLTIDIHHQESIQRATKSWMNGLRGLTTEDHLKALTTPPRIRNGLVLTHNVLSNQMGMEVLQRAT